MIKITKHFRMGLIIFSCLTLCTVLCAATVNVIYDKNVSRANSQNRSDMYDDALDEDNNGCVGKRFSIINICSDFDEAFKTETGEYVYPENFGGFEWNDCEFIIEITDDNTAPYTFLTNKYSVIRFGYKKYSIMYLKDIMDDLLDSNPDFAENCEAWVNYDVGIIMCFDAKYYDENLDSIYDSINKILKDLPEDLPIVTTRVEGLNEGLLVCIPL